MANATSRIPVLVTAAQKARFEKLARAAGMSTSEYLRRAAEAYRPSEDEALLEGLVEQVMKTTARAASELDKALAFIAASEARIAKIESAAKKAA